MAASSAQLSESEAHAQGNSISEPVSGPESEPDSQGPSGGMDRIAVQSMTLDLDPQYPISRGENHLMVTYGDEEAFGTVSWMPVGDEVVEDRAAYLTTAIEMMLVGSGMVDREDRPVSIGGLEGICIRFFTLMDGKAVDCIYYSVLSGDHLYVMSFAALDYPESAVAEGLFQGKSTTLEPLACDPLSFTWMRM